MINEENLNKLYNGLIDNKKLTTKELNGYGFNGKDLMNLINDGVLERVKRGYYSFLSIDSLFYYGKQLIASKEYDKATTCFLKCFELNPNHKRVCFQLFLRSIQNRNYEKAFEYFEHFYDSENEYYKNDSNFYLYLLSMITEIPEEHREYAKYLQLEDIKIDFNDKRFEKPYSQNKVRISALNQKFILASKQLNELIKQHGRLSVHDIIVRTLLSQAIEIQNDLKKNIINLATEKKYKEIISRLEAVQEQHHLSVSDEYLLFLAKEISKFKKTGIIPTKEIVSTNKLFEAINGKNFELALSLNKEYNERHNIDSNDNAMFVLLKDITELIKSKNKELTSQPIIESSKKEGTPTIEKVVPKTNTVSITSNITFADIIGYLMQNDLDNSFRSLRDYLNNINKMEYEFLIIDLIKISLLEKDCAFTKPMIALTYIARENFEFNISEYIQNFYETLAQNEFEKARIYLDIISKSNNLGQSCIFTESLEQVLNNTEKIVNDQRNNETLNKIEQSIQNTKNNRVPDTIKEPFVEQTSSADPEVISSESLTIETPIPKKEQSMDKVMDLSQNKDYDDNKFIQQKLNTLYEKGIILLRPMNQNRRKGIHDIVKNTPDVVSFSIGFGSSRRIVLRFKPDTKEYVDIKETLKAGDEAYKNGDYNTCISIYRRLLEFGEPRAFVYAKLGLAYMKKWDKNTAIDYLTVATEMNKNENEIFDFTGLIEYLRGNVQKAQFLEEEQKAYVKMSTSDFGNDVDDSYEIKEIKQVEAFVSCGMTIDDACSYFGLDDEQKSTITLIFAKKYYAQGNYKMGDQYLKKVEKTKNQSKFVHSLLEEVRKNKRFYKNRVEEKQKRFILTPNTKNISDQK